MPQENSVHFVAGPQEHGTQDAFLFHPFAVNPAEPPVELSIKEEFVESKLEDLLVKNARSSQTKFKLKDSFEESTSFETYKSLFQKAKAAIDSKELKKVILSQKSCVKFNARDTFHLYKKLLQNNPKALVFLFYHPITGVWIGASPELILTQENDRFSTTALAGTKTEEHSAWGDKEKEEHKLVSDFIINTLNSFSESVNSSDVYTEKAGKIFHLKQDISFKCHKVPAEILEELHPTPAIGGLPQKTAKAFILAHETHSRSYYCGFLGRVQKDKSSIFVNLRSAQLFNNQIHIYSGGGITKDSALEKEWQECMRKADNLKSLI